MEREALGMIECRGLVAMIEAADAAVESANVLNHLATHFDPKSRQTNASCCIQNTTYVLQLVC